VFDVRRFSAENLFMELLDFQRAYGAKVLAARLERQLSKSALAELSNLQTTDITQIEEGKRNACLDVVRRLSIALDKPAHYFFTWD
jgi:transcriptional regulator with XRE-family HTH domain